MTNTQVSRDAVVELPGEVAMPLLGFGTAQLDGENVVEAVSGALEQGYRHLETATDYGLEHEVGDALRKSGVPREEVFLTVRLSPAAMGSELEAIEESLDAFGTDYLDLWIAPAPTAGGTGLDTWRSVIEAKDKRLVRAVGVTNHTVDQIDDLAGATGVVPAVFQTRWGPFRYDTDLVADLRGRRVVLQGYGPLRSSALDHPILASIAQQHGKEPTQVVIAWHLQQGFGVLMKSVQEERIRANAAIDDLTLSAEEMTRLNGLATPDL